MPYLNNVGTLADIVGTPAAAMQSGQQQGGAQYQQDLENQLAQNTLAAKSQAPTLQNQQTQAQTANTNAVAQQNQTTAGTMQATQPGGIAATNAGNQAKVTADGVQSIQQLGGLAGQVAGMMDNVPPPARPAAMAQLLQQHGVDPSQLGPLASGDPDMLRKFATQSAQFGQQFLQSQALESQKTQSAQDINAQSNAKDITVAGMHDNAMRAALQGKQSIANSHQSISQAMAQVTSQIQQYQSSGQNPPPELVARGQALAKIYSANPNALAPQMIGGQPITDASQRASGAFTDQASSGGNSASSSATPDVSGTPAIQAAVTKAGGTYQPDKYMYRINPQSGQVEAKPR